MATTEVHCMEKNPETFSSKTLISFQLKKDVNILDGIRVSTLSGIFYSEVNYFFKLAVFAAVIQTLKYIVKDL